MQTLRKETRSTAQVLWSLSSRRAHSRPETTTSQEWKTDDFQFMQKSRVKSDKFQSSLLRLPIPKLPDTCRRYLASQESLLTPDKFEATKKLVESFEKGDGPQLHKELVAMDKANKHTSYISGPWSDMYLKDRRPVAFTHNPGIALADDPRPQFKDPAMRAANMLVSVLRFFKSWKSDLLYPDVFHMNPQKTKNEAFWQKVSWMPNAVSAPLAMAMSVFPLDMSQFKNLLQSTRLPCQGKDVIQSYPDSKHVVFLHKGCFYSLDVLDNEGNIMPPNYYLRAIKSISNGEKKKTSSGVGALTSADRDLWTEARKKLVELGNENSLNKIDSAIITICLDDWAHDEEAQEKAVLELCCGTNPENRWFDKSLSMIYSSNGLMGINFEHAWGDGVAVMRFCDDVISDSMKNAHVTNESLDSYNPTIEDLQFNLNDDINAMIQKAKKDHLKRLESVEFKAFRREGFGKKQCKTAKVGPDAVMQLGFQMAHLKLTGNFAPTYESCSTAIYKHGRTETVRPLTAEMKLAAEAFVKGESSDKVLLGLLQSCSQAHMQMTKNAAQGQGWDRHFFALRSLAAQQGKTPGIFQDPAFIAINHMILSTSTLSSTNFGVGGFCPVVPDGYGLGYQIRNEDLGVCVSVSEKNVDDMIDALGSSYDAISKVVS